MTTMKRGFLALALALTFLPVAALADDSSQAAPPALTPQQRQAIHQTMQTFGQREQQLHEQMRTQVLSSISPLHRAAIAKAIGEFAVSSANPDPRLLAKQIDVLLSQSEQRQIFGLHQSFETQMKALHQQMRAQLATELPAGMPEHHQGFDKMHQHMQRPAPDAGMLLLHALMPSPPHHMMMGGMGFGHR